MWYQVFNALTVAAIVVNCLMIGYTSTVLEKAYQLDGQHKLWGVLLLEHALLLLKLAVDSHIRWLQVAPLVAPQLGSPAPSGRSAGCSVALRSQEEGPGSSERV